MNVNGMVRSYMVKVMSDEYFLIHVAGLIERQLHEWDLNYEVFVMKFSDYELVVKKGDHYYHAELTEQELEVLHLKGSFSLDETLWSQLINQGLSAQEDYGNYMKTVLPALYHS
ncbi:MAG: hypothetical protein ACQEUT_16000 [Bacillota bacterium]